METTLELVSCWEQIIVDHHGDIHFVEPNPEKKLTQLLSIGSNITKKLSWFRLEWLSNSPMSRIVKTSVQDKYLLDVFPISETRFSLFFRNLKEYHNVEHLWCEVSDEIISLQKFIDSSSDGMTVTDGQGNILVVSESFVEVSGLTREKLIGKNWQQLIDEGIIPFSTNLRAIEQQNTCSAVMKFPSGKETVITSTLLKNKEGRIVRIFSNVRDLTELNKLHEKLNSAKQLAKGFQRELKVMHTANTDVHMGLVRSKIMENLYEMITKIANTDLQILITGSSGVGKTALAKFVHTISDRNSCGSFIHVNCSAIPETLLETELFGYEEGSFTGAKKTKVGLFDLANKGTLFLDEIGDMPLFLQAKILNVLQEEKFFRVGGTKEISVDVRIIAATNMNIEKLVAEGLFRRDLYYRLNVVPIYVPCLAERRDDIHPLIAYYLASSNNRYGKAKTISQEVVDVFLRYNWPGNIRELSHLIERLVVVVDDPVIEVKHLPEEVRERMLSTEMPFGEAFMENLKTDGFFRPGVHLKEIIKTLEEQVIEEAIEHCGSLKEASRSLGVDAATLFRKRKRKETNTLKPIDRERKENINRCTTMQ
ncbi:MAG: norR 28 [Firmicutes bacterium]|nr:norR 28 [Bacillota bacterium]